MPGINVPYYDNKYVQYRLMSDTFNTTVANWQGVDNEPTAGSNNLVKSGGVSKVEQNAITGGISLHYIYYGNHELGEEFEPLQLQSSELWNYYEMNCQEGDVIYANAYANYLLITNSNNIILKSITSPFGDDAPKWFIAPSGSTKVHLCGLASQKSFLYVFNKKNILQRTFLKRMFLEQDFIGTYWNAAAFITPSVPFNFYESLGNQSSYTSDYEWRTMIINVEDCPKVCITAYGNDVFSLQGTNIVPAYVFFDKDMMTIAGASRALTPYVNELIDVPANAVYCLAQSRKNINDVMLYAITDKEHEILDNVVQTREQTLSDKKKKQVIKNLGIINGDVLDIVNDGYYCNALNGDIGDTVTPQLVANNDWCSNIIEVSSNEVIFLAGYVIRYIILDNDSKIIAKKQLGDTTEGVKVVIPTAGKQFVYAVFKSVNHYAYYLNVKGSTVLNVYSERLIQREPYNIITVKKDGTGDFTSIQSAIDSVRNLATINNQYQVRIYDDWEFAAADLHYFNSGDCAVDTANYVHLYGCGGIRKLSILQNSSNPTVQTLWWIGNCNLTNLHIRITKGRYAVHQSGNYSGDNPPFITRIAENCIFEHTGHTDLGAIGTDIQDGEKTTFKNCKFISHSYGWYGHPTLKNYNAEISFVNCEFKTKKDIVNVISLDSRYPTIVKIDNCTINKKAIIANNGCGSYAENAYSEVGAVMPEMSVYGCGDFVFGASNSAFLRLQAQTGISITSISGTAYDVLFGGIQEERKGIGGLSGVIVGRNFVPYNDGSNHPYKYSLGKRLGDCSVTNKTMTIVLSNENNITVTFDKNYSNGSGDIAPNYTNEQIIADINTTLSSYGLTASIGFGSEHDFFPSTDRKNYVAAETSIIEQGKFVYIKPNGLVELANGNNISGFALADIPVNSNDNEENVSAMCLCKDILLGQPFSPVCNNTTDGTTFVIENGVLVESSTNPIAVIYDNTLHILV